jgi:hypothetical protein
MTETVSFRSRIPKRELQQRFGNVSETLNKLIERELSGERPARDWREVLKTPGPAISDEQWEQCLQPE